MEKNIVFGKSLVCFYYVAARWQPRVLFHLEPLDFVRIRDVSYGGTWSESSVKVCSVQFSHSVVSDSLRPHGLRLSPTPGVYSNSCLLSQWYHPTVSSSVVPFSSCPQSFPASGSFLTSRFSSSGGQSIGVSVSTSVLPVNIQDWFPLGWTKSWGGKNTHLYTQMCLLFALVLQVSTTVMEVLLTQFPWIKRTVWFFC